MKEVVQIVITGEGLGNNLVTATDELGRNGS